MTFAATFATFAWATSVLTTLLSLAQHLLNAHRELRRIGTPSVEERRLTAHAREVGHEVSGGFDYAVVGLQSSSAPRVWTRPDDWREAEVTDIERTATKTTRQRDLHFQGRVFVAADLLATFDPRPLLRQHLIAGGSLIVAVVAASVLVLALGLGGHLVLAAGAALAQFLMMPVAERWLRTQCRPPHEPGRTFVEAT